MHQNFSQSFGFIFFITLFFPSMLMAGGEKELLREALSVNAPVNPSTIRIYPENQHPKQALDFYQEFLAESSRTKTAIIPPFVYFDIGRLYKQLANYDAAFENFSLVLENPTTDQQLRIETLSEIARTYSLIEDIHLSHKFLLKIKEFKKTVKDEELLRELYSLGDLFVHQRDYEEALQHFKLVLDISKQTKKQKYICDATLKLSIIYEELGQSSKSLTYSNEALVLAEQINYQAMMSRTLHNLGAIYTKQNSHKKAIDYFLRSLIFREKKDKRGHTSDYIALGSSYLKLNKTQEAKEYLDKALRLSKEVQAQTYTAKTYALLAEFYKKTNEIHKEREYLQKYIALQDSMLNEKSLTNPISHKNIYDLQKKESEINLLKSEAKTLQTEKKTNTLKNGVWITAISSLLLLVIFLFHNWKKQQSMARLLQEKHAEIEEKNEKIQIQNKLLEQSNIELQNFAYVASHDLKEPLRMVNSFSGLLKRRYDDVLDERGNEYMYYITDAVERMGILLDDLLDYSRVNTTQKEFDLINTANIAAKIKMDMTPILQEKSGEILIQYQNMPEICGNKSQFSQLLQNLISNGLKFHNGKPPVVEVNCEERNHDYLFSIKDNGIGISNENQAKIFDMFTRLHTREKYAGTGIGLSTCKKIVDRYNGEIWVESKENQGATFYFTIPK